MALENSSVHWPEAMYKSALTLQENSSEELKNEVELLFMPSVFLLQFLDLVRLDIKSSYQQTTPGSRIQSWNDIPLGKQHTSGHQGPHPIHQVLEVS